MPKCSLKNRILQRRAVACVFTALGLVAIIQLFAYYGSYNYTHIPEESILSELYRRTVPHLPKQKQQCRYEDILQSAEGIEPWEIPMNNDDFSPAHISNGSFFPACNPEFSVAVLVTYRNRQKQLDVFLPYMHNFLRKQNIHYKIYLIEQRDEKPWNKGILYNVGAKHAIADKFPCLVLHDVDLLPLQRANLYVCTRQPRHMSASIDKFRYVLPYAGLVGGALAITAEQYVAVNGFSNRFEGWGGEDDDLAARLAAHNLTVLRFPVRQARYTMLAHVQEARNARRADILRRNRRARARDGYDARPYRHTEIQQHRLFTMIGVKL